MLAFWVQQFIRICLKQFHEIQFWSTLMEMENNDYCENKTMKIIFFIMVTYDLLDNKDK